MGQHKDIFSNLKDCMLRSFWLSEANIYVCVRACTRARSVLIHSGEFSGEAIKGGAGFPGGALI